ncbi:MAG TPA: lasso peptide biosynthesis B2 protein [Steroidobacteraceae bacterium]|nr:lasso peptide biosynthesis B2 protein [Steroidobacteraceae bacterium]
MTSDSYFLSPHVHVCLAGRQVVLLDLERDKYLAIEQTQPLARWVRGWPAPPGDGAAAAAENGLLAKMLAQGLLVTDPLVGKEAAPVVTERAHTAVVEFDLDVHTPVRFAQLRHLFAAYLGARWALRHWPIKKVIQVARERKPGVSAAAWDMKAVRTLVMAFVQLRPLFYGAQGACLLDSLTLIRFLARYGLQPQWIFGVKTDPFYAHCWVQHDGYVLNDTPDYIKGFTPILVV